MILACYTTEWISLVSGKKWGIRSVFLRAKAQNKAKCPILKAKN
jgi:hypothetical protein